jgi:hypothetical protein
VPAFSEEMQRTAFQKKAVLKIPPADALRYATTYLAERGYRAGPAARPNQIFVLGAREGSLPRVTGEIRAQPNVGKPGTTLVTVDGFGERLGPTLKELLASLRAESKARVADRATGSRQPGPSSTPMR